MAKKYKWVATSNDGWEDESTKDFDTKKEAYNDMRESVFSKMHWNTEFDEDLSDDSIVDYKVEFRQNRIIHKSFSGVYTYQVVEIEDEKDYLIYADVTICVHDFIKAKSEDEACKIFRERIANNARYYVNKYDSVFNTEITDCVEE
jgi:hypothetical protein